MYMKIMLANVAVPEEGTDSERFVKDVLVPAWGRNFDLVRQPDTYITARFSKWGITGLDGFFYSYLDTLNAQSVFHAAVQAEKEGFDAVLITCFGDPMLYQIRQAVSIPVVSLGESAMLLAATMGHKFGIVTISALNIFEQDHLIDKYGLTHRYAGSRPNPETAEEQPMALVDAHNAIAAFKGAARELIADGAEIIIPGCGLLSPALRLVPGAESEYPDGFTEVDGVPVMDVMGTALKMAEMLVTLKKAGSTWISRKGLFAQATEAAMASGSMVLKDERMAYWDTPVCE
jgi:Asp/Glu/hydantoin racemase